MKITGIPWVLVILLLIFVTPIGVVLLIIKLSESNTNARPQKRPMNWNQTANRPPQPRKTTYQAPPVTPKRPTPPPPPKAATPPPPPPKPVDEMDEKYLSLKAAAHGIVTPKIQLRAGDIANTVEKIFAHVRKYPKKRVKLNRFENHYLPMTTHLLERYNELEKQPHKGEHITTAMTQIEEALEAVDKAFKTQLDQLFSVDAMDISADVKVMEQLFEKDGLGQEHDFFKHADDRRFG